MTKIWQSTEFRKARSYLTGNELLINTADQFLVPPSFAPIKVLLTLEEFATHLPTLSERRRPRPDLRSRFDGFTHSSTPEEFGDRLAYLVSYENSPACRSDLSRIRDFLIRLWHNGALVWPCCPVFSPFHMAHTWGWGDAPWALLKDLDALQALVNRGAERTRVLTQFLLSCQGFTEVGDLTPDVMGPHFDVHAKKSSTKQSVAADILRLQQDRYGTRVSHALGDFGTFGRVAVRSDDAFAWARRQDPTVSPWVDLMTNHMGTISNNTAHHRAGMNHFLDHLIANPTVTRDPLLYLKTNYTSPAAYVPASEVRKATPMGRFADFVLDTRCFAEDDLGYKVRLPGFRNPFEQEGKPSRPAETHREAMPTRFVRMLKQILVEDDFAWPRQYGVARWNYKGGDMAKWIDQATGTAESVWSPVRAITMLVKLLIPARTFQVRMLDSGEADAEEYQPLNNTWTSNPSALAKAVRSSAAKGVFYRHKERDGQEFVFLRFNTNKTADIDKSPLELGYVMPWEHGEVIKALAYLRDWQKKYNPLSAPTAWADIKDMSVSTRYSRDFLEARGTNCFLFRDACSPFKDQPVTDSRLTLFWRNLNLELERRLAAAGETLPDGTPIVLVQKTARGIGAATYDLHSLRVTLITALAESGGVPPVVLMKVVGHASVIMTLYYIKLSATHICEHLNAAEIRLYKDEQLNWQRWLTQHSRDTLMQAVAFTSTAGVEVLTSSTPTSWVIRDHGICPVGCMRCDEGGEAIVDSNAYRKWAPVPGGAANCVRCRFFISGPPFLLGLQSHFDDLGFRLRQESEKYQAVKSRFESLEAAYHTRQEGNDPVSRQALHQLNMAAGQFDQATNSIDELALSWHATYRLIQQCLGILRAPSTPAEGETPPTYALVAVGGMVNVEIALQECPDFELMDRVCQSAVFFDGVDATLANLKRMRVFDAMLKRNGFEPAFIDMQERDALEAGNQMAAFLFTRYGRDSANALISGQETLRRLGIEQEVVRKLKSVVPMRRVNHSQATEMARDAPRLGTKPRE